MEEINLEEILNTDDEGDMEYIVEIDLEYPDQLHYKHSYLLLILDKEPPDPIELSQYQYELKNALKILNSFKKRTEIDISLKKNYVTD